MRTTHSKKVLLKITVSLAAFIIGIALFEIGFRIFLPQPLEFYSLYKIMHSTPGKSPSHELIPNARSNYYGVPNAINSLGFRDREFGLKKPEGIRRIVFIGDSVAYGVGMRLEESFPKIVERMLNEGLEGEEYETINAGVVAYNFSNELAFFQNRVLQLNPDVVVLGITLNDTADDVKGVLKKRKSMMGNFIFMLNHTLRNRSHLYFFLQERIRRPLHYYGVLKSKDVKVRGFLEGDFSEKDRRRLTNTLSEMKRLSAARDIKFAAVIFPYEMQLDKERLDRFSRQLNKKLKHSILDAAPQKLIRDVCEKMDIPVLDLLTAFREQRDVDLFIQTSVFLDWSHLSPAGHLISAREIVKFLASLQIT
jgi:lysophospholipase L1-like esterase